MAESVIVHNCTHNLAPFIPGATTVDPPLEQDGETYQASQTQRSLERELRRWVRREAAAMDPASRLEATLALTAIDDDLERLVDRHPKLVRKPHRESPYTSR